MITYPVIKNVDFLTSTGILKKLEPPSDQQKCYLIASLQQIIDDFTCVCCLYLYEKPLYTRICEHPLCVECYIQLDRQKCPSCSKDLPKNPSDGLCLAPRSVINLLNDALKNYITKSTTLDIQSKNKYELQKGCIDEIDRQKNKAIIPYSSSTRRPSINSTESINNNTIFTRPIPLPTGLPYNISRQNRTRNNFFPRNSDANPEETIFNNNDARHGHNRTSSLFSSNIFYQPNTNHSMYTTTHRLSTFNKLILGTITGDIIIDKDLELSDTLKIVCRRQYRINIENSLMLNVGYDDIQLIIPYSFSKKIMLSTISGSITSLTPLKSEGNIRSTNGNINVKIDIESVEVKLSTRCGYVDYSILDIPCINTGRRNPLFLHTNTGILIATA